MVYQIYTGDTLWKEPVRVADSFWTRFKGLMLRKSLKPGEALLLKNCSSIHCCFMRFTIDVIYLDDNMTVLDTESVKPWRLGKIVKGAKHVLETEEHSSWTITPGEKLVLKEKNDER